MARALHFVIMASKRFWKGAAMVSGQMLGTMAVFTCVLTGIVFWIRPAMRKHKKTDLRVFDFLEENMVSEKNTEIMLAVTKLAKHQFLIPANLSLIFYFLFVRKQTWFSIRVASIALSSLGLMLLLKKLFKRKRPIDPLVFQARGLSFPSGHAIMSVTFYGLLIYIISQTEKNKPLKESLILSLIVLILLIGFSRVYLRVHYASDVAVGYIVGLVWLLIALDLLKRIEDYNKQQRTIPAQIISSN
ncbi:MAG: phosphatase PAP2 family protein [Chitinophagaceae bacterium]